MSIFDRITTDIQRFDPQRHMAIKAAMEAVNRKARNPAVLTEEQLRAGIEKVVGSLYDESRVTAARIAGCRTRDRMVSWRMDEVVGRVHVDGWEGMVRAALTAEEGGGLLPTMRHQQPGDWRIAAWEIVKGMQTTEEPARPRAVKGQEVELAIESLAAERRMTVGVEIMVLAVELIDVSNSPDVTYDAKGQPMQAPPVNVRVEMPQPMVMAASPVAVDQSATIAAMQAQIAALLAERAAPPKGRPGRKPKSATSPAPTPAP